METQIDLQRFVEAQDAMYETVLDELRAGHKETHWIWFIFPQLAGLGRSETSQRYALASLAQASAFLAHHLLGARLLQCCTLAEAIEGKSAEQIFGSIDAMKFRSSLTLFGRAAPHEPVFQACLDKYFGGRPDPDTLARLPA